MNSQTANDSLEMNTAKQEENFVTESEDSSDITNFSSDETNEKEEITIEMQRTMPEEVNFELGLDNDVLIFNLISEENHNETVLADEIIESVLAIAQNNGFHYVLFENVPLRSSDAYNLSEPIKVPSKSSPDTNSID